MKRILSSSLLAAFSVAVISCDQSKQDTSAIEQRLEELEREKIADQKRQQALEQELADQKIAREWEAIERERLQISEARAQLEARAQSEGQSEALAAIELETLRLRDAELAAREAQAGLVQADLNEDRSRLAAEKVKLDEQALALAGREASNFAQANDTQVATVDYQFFDNALSPYGTWFETAEYGSVWQPAACTDPSWRPYSRGHWVCSDRGWTWVSQEPFGWATYHYGRWALLHGGRWIWVPGSEWAPSWCTWRSGDSHIGWAPLPPETLAYPGRGWDSRVESQYGIAASCYNFVDVGNFGKSVASYCLPSVQNTSFFRVTTNITNIKIVNQQVFCGGPSYREVSKRLSRPIPYYQIERSHESYDRPNQGHLRSQVKGAKLIVAAPRIERNEREATRPNHKQVGIRIERNATADPEALNAYREVRERELERRPAQQPSARPVDPPMAVIVPDREREPRNQGPQTPARDQTIRPALPVRPASQPRIADAEKVERPTMERDRVRPGATTRPGRLPAGQDQAAKAAALARQQQLERDDLERREAMNQKAQAELVRQQQIELEARKKQADDLRKQAEIARNEQTGRETRMRSDAQQRLEETARQDRATAEARQLKERQDGLQKQRDDMKQKVEAARQQQAEQEARQRMEAQQKLKTAAQEKQKESMRQAQETGRKDRATAEARQKADRQVKEQQDAAQKQREDMRQKVEAAQKQQAEQEATRRELAQQKLEQAAREKEQDGMREKVETGRRDRANTEARQQAERQLKEQQDAGQRQREDMRQKAEAAQKQQAEQEAARREQAAREKQQEEMRQQAEATRKAQAEEAARRQKEEAERAQRAEEQRKQMEEARRQQEEARRQQEEARRQQAEAQRRQQEEAQRRQQQEQQQQ